MVLVWLISILAERGLGVSLDETGFPFDCVVWVDMVLGARKADLESNIGISVTAESEASLILTQESAR